MELAVSNLICVHHAFLTHIPSTCSCICCLHTVVYLCPVMPTCFSIRPILATSAVRSNDFGWCPGSNAGHSLYGAICKTPCVSVCARFKAVHIWQLLKTAVFGVPSSVASVAALWLAKTHQKLNSSHLSWPQWLWTD